MFTEEQFREIAEKARKQKLEDMGDDVYESLREQGRTDISRAQIKVIFHETYPLVATSVENIQKCLSDAKYTVEIKAKRNTTSSDEIRLAAAGE